MIRFSANSARISTYITFIGVTTLFILSVIFYALPETTVTTPSFSVNNRKHPHTFSRGYNAMCTITAKNYLARVRTLIDLFHIHNPRIPVFVLLVDQHDGYFDPALENFTLVTLDTLHLKDTNDMLFRYNAKEACTSFKPAFLRYLLQQHRVHKLVYLDPDIWVQDSFSELWAKLTDHSMIVTPHIVAPIPDDGKMQTDMKILRAGTMNLGFLAVNHAFPECLEFLDWWHERLRVGGAMVKVEDGYHYDQKWVDLALSFHQHVLVLRDQAYNVAYWNLHERGHLIEQRDDGYYYIGQATRHTRVRRIVFFHFSGMDPDNYSMISYHQNRYSLADFPVLKSVIQDYLAVYTRHLIPTNILEWPYAYNYAADGTFIHPSVRRMYGEIARNEENEDLRADPFHLFLPFARQPVSSSSPVPWFLYELWKQRHDLQHTFPMPLEYDKLFVWYKNECDQKTKHCILDVA